MDETKYKLLITQSGMSEAIADISLSTDKTYKIIGTFMQMGYKNQLSFMAIYYPNFDMSKGVRKYFDKNDYLMPALPKTPELRERAIDWLIQQYEGN